jgi:chlorobactene glucosyltransferase
MPNLYLTVLLCANAWFLFVALANVAYFRRSTSRPRVTHGPFVSVIVPARDEAGPVDRCLQSLSRQDYDGFEVIVVDDQSSDATAEIVDAHAAHDPRVRLVSGVPLPDGWMGKTHALAQGAAVARGEILLLTDADTVHTPESISWAVTNMEDHRADIVSGYLKQTYGSLGESVIVPTMYAMMLLLPLFLLPRVRSARVAFAIGQYVVVRRTALDAIGGFESIKGSLVDDMSMAVRMKQNGFRNVFLDARQAAGCRLYTGYREAFRGIERSVYSALGGNPFGAMAVMAVVVGLIVWPAVWLLGSYLRFEMPPAAVAASVALFAVQWALVTWDRDIPVVALPLYPLVFLNLAVILAASMVTTGFGHGVDWKGRTVRSSIPEGAAAAAELADAAARSGKET